MEWRATFWKAQPIHSYVINPAALNPTADNMLQRSGGIYAGSARQAGILPAPIKQITH